MDVDPLHPGLPCVFDGGLFRSEEIQVEKPLRTRVTASQRSDGHARLEAPVGLTQRLAGQQEVTVKRV